MKGVQGSDSAARPMIQNQASDSVESSTVANSSKQSGQTETKIHNVEAEKKGASQIAQQNKATKDLEASVRQHDLQGSLPQGGIVLASGKPPAGLKHSESTETNGVKAASKLKANPGDLIYAEKGIAIFKKNGNHTVYGENKDLIPGKSKDGVNGVYVEDSEGKPRVFIFDKNGKDGEIGHFTPNKYTPQQIVKMWEEERAKNPKGSNEEIKQAVVNRR